MIWTIAVALFAAIGALSMRRLLSRGFPASAAGAIVFLALVQMSVSFTGPTAAPASLLCLSVYAVAASAALLARRQDLRSIVLVSGALTGAQIVTPLGGVFTAAVLPALIGLPRSKSALRKSAGLVALLLFLPAVSAILIAYLPQAMLRFAAVPVSRPGSVALAGALSLLPLAAVTLIDARRRQSAGATLFVGVALLLALFVSRWLGAVADPREAVAAVASLGVVGCSEWPATVHRSRDALLTAAGGALLGWLATVPV
jgi:hypothetical protein